MLLQPGIKTWEVGAVEAAVRRMVCSPSGSMPTSIPFSVTYSSEIIFIPKAWESSKIHVPSFVLLHESPNSIDLTNTSHCD